MLDIKHLITVKTIAETDSLAEASKILNLTLSAVSHQVKQLENYYECTLFTRKTKPIEFTREGRMLLDLADSVLPDFREVEYKLRLPRDTTPKHFNMALECHSCYQWLIPTLSHFRQHWPQVETDLSTEFNFNPLPQLLGGELNLVITADPVHHMDIEYIPLFDFKMMVGVSDKSQLAKKDYIEPEDLTIETIIAYPVKDCKISIINQFMRPAGITPYKIRHTELTIMAIELAAISQGICCLPEWAFAEHKGNKDIKLLALGPKGLTQTLYIACRYVDKDSTLVQDFIRIAKINCVKHLENISLHEDVL